MSLPNVPNITPTITVTTADAINLLLISIALEEIGLSHIINAEAEKIQYVVGTLPGLTPHSSIEDILRVDKDVRATLSEVIRKEMLLQMKLETILNSRIPPITNHPCPPEGPTPTTYAPYR
ncbi:MULTISPECIES: hypothetical protein [Paenibacillus]|uniref:hypothetical protein n=1 Tax=Paenibacillus TaxID=44249 RepID=UPI001B87B01A|nr:hypothetical protein [Paenibacillus anaericanus]